MTGPPPTGPPPTSAPPIQTPSGARTGPEIALPSEAGTGARWRPADHENLLHCFHVADHPLETMTLSGDEVQAARLHQIIRWDNDGEPLVWKNALVFNRVLIARFADLAGKLVVGIPVQGTPTQRGWSPPWLLDDPSEAQLAWVTDNRSEFTSPSGEFLGPLAQPDEEPAPSTQPPGRRAGQQTEEPF